MSTDSVTHNQTVKERPILFRASMVKALLAGRKTQTRRIIKGVQNDNCVVLKKPTKTLAGVVRHVLDAAPRCPYGQPGTRLWVRENGWQPKVPSLQELRDGADTWPKYAYDADEDEGDFETFKKWGWKRRPSIYMPRWASRITLEITDVRVEKLHDISARDCIAEGFDYSKHKCGCETCATTSVICPASSSSLVMDYAALWQSINGNWAENPWLWVIGFKVVSESTMPSETLLRQRCEIESCSKSSSNSDVRDNPEVKQ